MNDTGAPVDISRGPYTRLGGAGFGSVDFTCSTGGTLHGRKTRGHEGCSARGLKIFPPQWTCGAVALLPLGRPTVRCWPRLTLAFDAISHVEGEAHRGQGLQRGHAGLQGPVCRGLLALMPLPQHLSDAHHGEPASACHTIRAPQGSRGAVARNQRWGTHALLFWGAVLVFMSKGDQSGMQRSLER